MSSRVQIACAGVATVAAAAAFLLHHRRRRRAPPPDAPGLIFTGTGCSSGLPLTGCTLGQEWAPKGCQACGPALRHGRSDPNWRGNVGALLRFKDAAGRLRLVQIDCGKTYREVTAIGVYKQHGVKAIDALLLTHDHADAIGGLDELRSLQPYDPVTMEVGTTIRCVCDRRTLTRCRHMFPYLFPKRPTFGVNRSRFPQLEICQACDLDLEPSPAGGGTANGACLANGATPAAAPAAPADAPAAPAAAPAPAPPASAPAAPAAATPAAAVKRFVARIDWESFGDAADLARLCEIELCGLQLTCLPVMHGADYVCFGYGFGAAGSRCAYLSDYTALLPQTEALLEEWSQEGGLALLVLDALRPSGAHPVHATMEESVALARRLRPRRTLLVGMGHAMEHHATNRRLRRLWSEEGLDVQLAHDGQFVPLEF